MNRDGGSTFRSFWGTPGYVGFTPLQNNTISTGTYYSGAVALGVNRDDEFEMAIYFYDHGDASLASRQVSELKRIRDFLEQ